MNITDEIVEAATRAIHDVDCRNDVCAGKFSLDGRYGRWARAAIAAAAPLIAAQALRSAAEDVRDNDDVHSHGDRCSYGPPGTCDCERGATFRWLVSRAAGRCGAPDPTGAADACDLDPGHDPAAGHRYGSVEQLPERCCTRSNMVWEHSRAGKDHFRCKSCGGGMTKARASS
jgi:hypothetical protein